MTDTADQNVGQDTRPSRASRRSSIPPTWQEKRLRFSLSLNPSWRQAAHLKDEDEVSFVPMEAVGEFGGLDMSITKPIGDIGSGYTFFADGDVVVAKITPCFENGKGALARNLTNGFAFGTTELHVLRAKSSILDPEYLFYLSISQPFRALGESSMYGAGGQKRVSEDFVKNFRWPLPPLAEQRAIAAFLDRETARIDALIERKRRLIELLQEKRAAVISNAVTKGLDPLASMKDSGEKWMGRVPADWNVAALGYLATVETGATPDRDNAAFWDGDIPWIKTGEIDYRPIRGAEECITQVGLLNSSARISPPGTLLMAMYGQGTTRGRVALLEVHAAYNQACAAIRFGPRVIGEFGRYFFIAAYDFIRDFGNETSQMNLSASIIRKFRVPVPSLDEQAAIVSRLNSETSTIEALAGRVQSVIDLLQERRSAIIAAAVTGQVDVREAA